jgi:hypothetical protein
MSGSTRVTLSRDELQQILKWLMGALFNDPEQKGCSEKSTAEEFKTLLRAMGKLREALERSESQGGEL